jgi:hypothetical protein
MTATEKLEITAVDVRHFKRLADVHVETGAHRNLLLIAGKNTQGKSSLMDALSAALGGKDALPADPVRHGADRAEIVVALDGGRYTITRTITGKGKEAKSSLRIVGPDGPVAAPQTWLDSLVSGRFLDPVAFLARDAKAQRQILLALVGVDVDAIDAERKAVFEARTQVNRDAKAAAARRDGIGAPPPAPPATRPLVEIQAEGDKIAAQLAEAAAVRATAAQAAKALEARKADRARWARELERLRAEIERAERELAAADQAIAAAEAPAPEVDTAVLEARRAELRAEYAAANARAAWEAAAKAHAAQLDRADAEVLRLQAEADAKTIALAEIDARKAKLLAAAEMPVPGLEVGDDGLLLGGVPFGQASQAERLRCALAIAMRQSPKFRDIWVRDGALLDEDGIEIVREVAAAQDCRVWLEVVGEDAPAAIVIRDGRLVDGAPPKRERAAKVLSLVPPADPPPAAQLTTTTPVGDDEPDLF